MINKNKLCALIVLMVIGTCSISYNSVYAEDGESNSAASELESSDTEVIKGNKSAFETAEDLVSQKDYQNAIRYLDAYIISKPKKYEGYKLRGDAYYALRRYDLAEQDYQTAVDLKTDDDKFITGTKVISAVVLGADKQEQLQNTELGNLYARLMYAQKAQNKPSYETSYSKAVEYNSHIYLPQPKKEDISRINCPQKYGKVFNPQGDDEYLYGAIEDIENENYRASIFKSQYLITNYPDYYLGYYLNGVALSAMEQDDEAVIAFETALKKNPYDFESFASLGQLYYAKAEKTFSASDADKSTQYFKKALALNPNCNSYYFYIGLNELQQGNSTSAIDSFNNAIKLKSNDYNSKYYKIIAQYLAGDYNSSVSGATELLYKHVSNYNSVLYLQALAQYKLGNYNSAIENLEKIYNSSNDIYNADIRYTSNKEKTLSGYCYYLKSKVLNKQGLGAKSDLAKAYENPIIAKLAGVENSLSLYEPQMDKSTISLDDYQKFNKAYNSAISLLHQSDFTVTVDDIDTQYDYIRTTFDDIGVSFDYNGSSYKVSSIDNYVFKKYASKLSAEDFKIVSENLGDEKLTVLRPKEVISRSLQASTPQTELIGENNRTSIAQMLASQSLLPAAENKVVNNDVSETLNVESAESEAAGKDSTVTANISKPVPAVVENLSVKDKIIISSPVQQPSETFEIRYPGLEKKIAQTESLSSPEPVIIKESTTIQNSVKNTSEELNETTNDIEKSSDILKSAAEQNLAENTISGEGFKIVAPEIKESPDFTISYPETSPSKPVVEKVLTQTDELISRNSELADENIAKPVQKEIKKAKETSKQIQNPNISSEKIAQASSSDTLAEKQSHKIVEKHADINPADFGVNPVKSLPFVENSDDVVKLETKNFIYKAENQIPTDSFEIKYPKQVPNAFSGLKISDNAPVQKQTEQTKDERIILPETETENSSLVSNSKSVIEKTSDINNKETAVPIVIVPEIKAPKISTPEKDKIAVVNEKTIVPDIRPAVDTTEKVNLPVETKTVNVEKSVSPVTSKGNVINTEGAALIEKPVKEVKAKKEKTQKQVEKSANAKKSVNEAKQKVEKPVKEKVHKTKANVQPEESEVLQDTPVKEKKVKVKKEKVKKQRAEKPEKISDKEKAITSIINETMGVEDKSGLTTEQVGKTKSEKPVKAAKIKKEKTIKEKSLVNNEMNTSEDIKYETPSKSSFWNRFKKSKSEKVSNSEHRTDENIKNVSEDIKQTHEKSSKVVKVKKDKPVKEKLKEDKENITTNEVSVNTESKSSFWQKFRKTKTEVSKSSSTSYEGIRTVSENVEQNQQKSAKETKAKKEKVKKVKNISSNVSETSDSAEAIKADNSKTEKKKFHWWFSKKDKSDTPENHTAKGLSRLFSKQSGDNSAEYTVNSKNKDKKIIKELEK